MSCSDSSLLYPQLQHEAPLPSVYIFSSTISSSHVLLSQKAQLAYQSHCSASGLVREWRGFKMEQKVFLWLSSPPRHSLSPSTNWEARVKMHIEPVNNASYSISSGNRKTGFAKCFPELDVSLCFLYVFFFPNVFLSNFLCLEAYLYACSFSCSSLWREDEESFCVFACECWWKHLRGPPA